jgi:hypothetical protein
VGINMRRRMVGVGGGGCWVLGRGRLEGCCLSKEGCLVRDRDVIAVGVAVPCRAVAVARRGRRGRQVVYCGVVVVRSMNPKSECE